MVGFSIRRCRVEGRQPARRRCSPTIAWALFAWRLVFLWELPVMPPRLVWISRRGLAADSVSGGVRRIAARQALRLRSRSAGYSHSLSS